MLLQKLSHYHSWLLSRDEPGPWGRSGSPEADSNTKGSSECDERRKKDDTWTSVAGITGWADGENKIGVLPYSQTNFRQSIYVKFTNKTKSLDKRWKN